MTEKTLKKIDGTVYKAKLEHYKNLRHQYLEMERKENEKAVHHMISAYVQALCDCGVITERERMSLYIYYATI